MEKNLLKEFAKATCEQNKAMGNFGVINFMGNDIHMRLEDFRNTFKEYAVCPHCDEYDKAYVVEDGYEFFALIER